MTPQPTTALSAEELMIGNWIVAHLYSVSVETVIRHGLDIQRVLDNPGDYSGVPITPDILKKCGFLLYSQHAFHNWKLPNGWRISMWMLDEQPAGFEEKGVCYWGDNYSPIRYLHQLQNLYHSLTGSHLTLKP